MITGNPVVLINRTPRVLNFVADGQHYELLPGENYGYTSGHVRFAKTQNILRGTENYSTLRFESLIAVKGTKDLATELTDGDLQAAEELSQGERFDRSTFGPGAQKTKSHHNRHLPMGRIAGVSGQEAFAVGE